MNKVSVTELGYIGFDVSDLGAWRAYVTEVLGMEFVAEAQGARLRMDYWHQRIVLHNGDRDDIRYAGFRLSGPEAFWAMTKQLDELGVKFEVASADEAEDRHVLELMKLEDPAGLPIELFHGPQVDRHEPFLPGRRMHGKFVSGAQGMGHMIIRERGIAVSERFYREALGMQGSIEAKLEIGGRRIAPVFLHCNQREHSIAFGTPPFKKQLQHFMIEVDTLEDVGLAYDIARDNKVPILLDLGCHQNDRMVSFYTRTPSGFFCEYGWGGSSAPTQSEYNPRGDSWGHRLLDPSLLE
jgi:2,3-dihydroxyethylbenzene 1,2-dioxygenase